MARRKNEKMNAFPSFGILITRDESFEGISSLAVRSQNDGLDYAEVIEILEAWTDVAKGKLREGYRKAFDIGQ